MEYDLCIVGTGLWGSAASRHASKSTGRKVCLIGPSEPTQHERRELEIFSSHYDAGRNVRKYQGTNHYRCLLSMRTLANLRELEKISGTKLFNEVGHLMYGEKLHEQLSPIAQEAGIFLSASQLRDRYPFLDISQYGDTSFLFPHDAGYVNPRLLVGTQQRVAKQQGCDIIDDVVESVTETKTDDGEPVMRVMTTRGRTLSAKKVLLCTGVFTNFKKLLPPHLKLDFKIHGTFLVKLEVARSDLERFGTMPCTSSYTNTPEDSYSLPPIQYPDGNYYMKIGRLSNDGHVPLTTLQEVKEFYVSTKTDDASVNVFKDIMVDIVKGFSPLSVQSETCSELKTPSKLPYCDMVSPRLGIAIGGNGLGAMMSDEMGRMAAEMIGATEGWNLDIPKEQLRARFVLPKPNL
ncbi:uncharacterized protein LOC117307164 [Asterias rubens]|uniref:uncharacterized protein LOC117307164 n=1 Tax=Asterias rubens TaxID=7604 RepID=UPI0014553B66|nr:uncharacterized protein LOC117307164 [Asterias rubens]